MPRFSVTLIKLLIVAIEIQKKMLILFDIDARLGSQPLYNFCIFTYITYIFTYITDTQNYVCDHKDHKIEGQFPKCRI